MRNFLLPIILVAFGCSHPLAVPTPNEPSPPPTVYTVIAQCGATVCPWTPDHADDVFVANTLAAARVHFVEDARGIAQAAGPTLQCDIVGLAMRFTSEWITAMSDTDIECRTPEGADFHLLAYATPLSP